MEIKELAGEHILQGIENGIEDIDDGWGWNTSANYIKIKLNGTTYKMVEDPDDGYRSICREPIIVDGDPGIPLPNIPVRIEYSDISKSSSNSFWVEKEDIISIFDKKNNELIAEIGTRNTDDYYPYSVMRWLPENLNINEVINED